MRTYAFLYNPSAGKSTSKKRLKKIQSHINRLPQSRLFILKNKAQISATVHDLSTNYDVIVACGGDGTIREIAQSLVGTQTTLGVIPMGSGNDLVKSLGISTNLNKAFHILTECKPISIDVGKCNDFIFLNTLGFGFDGLTTRYASNFKWFNGLFRYLVAAFKANINLQTFRVNIRGDSIDETREAIMVTLANGRVEGGGFWLAPDASLTDGKLSLITIDPISRWLLPLYLSLTFIKKAHLNSKFKMRKITELTLSFDQKVAIHSDGEIIDSSSTHFEIEVLAGAINIICHLNPFPDK